MKEREAFPLSWPVGWKRTQYPKPSHFHTGNSYGSRQFHSMARVLGDLQRELKLLGADDVIISTNIELRRDGVPYANQRQPMDKGAAVYFILKKKPVVLACDKWGRVECNLWAITKHVESLRGQDRWGVGSLDQAFAGYMALPSTSQQKNWWDVFGCAAHESTDQVTGIYRSRLKKLHPDVGGDNEAMAELNAAYDAFKAERGLE